MTDLLVSPHGRWVRSRSSIINPITILLVYSIFDAPTAGVERVALLTGFLALAFLPFWAATKCTARPLWPLGLMLCTGLIGAIADPERSGSLVMFDLLQLTSLMLVANARWSASDLGSLPVLGNFDEILKWPKNLVLVGCLVVPNLLFIQPGVRGEIPATALLGLSAYFLASRRSVAIGAISLAGYAYLGLENGYRSSGVLMAVALLLIAVRGLAESRGASAATRWLLVIVVSIIAITGSLSTGSAQSRAFQFDDDSTALSNSERIQELQLMTNRMDAGSNWAIVFGSGLASSPFEDGDFESDRVIGHNVFAMMIFRHGLAGLGFCIWMHWRISRRAWAWVRGDLNASQSFVSITGPLVLIACYLRYEISHPGSLLLLGLACTTPLAKSNSIRKWTKSNGSYVHAV